MANFITYYWILPRLVQIRRLQEQLQSADQRPEQDNPAPDHQSLHPLNSELGGAGGGVGCCDVICRQFPPLRKLHVYQKRLQNSHQTPGNQNNQSKNIIQL